MEGRSQDLVPGHETRGPTGPAQCAVTVRYDGQQVVVSLHGEVDADSLRGLAPVVAAALEAGCPDLVLDLRSVSFFGAAGLGLVSRTAAEVQRRGGDVEILTGSRSLHGLLDLIGVGHLAAAGAGERPERGRLRDLLELVGAVVPGCDGASISVRRDVGWETAAATSAWAAELDGEQYRAGRGPCLEAVGSGRSVHSDHLDREERWPELGPTAQRLAVSSVRSTPVVLQGTPTAALNVYSRQRLEPGPGGRLDELLAEQVAALLAAPVGLG